MNHGITLKDIYNYIEGNGRRALDQAGVMPVHLKEQIAYRMLKCKDCMAHGKCQVCGCGLPGRLYTTDSCNHGTRFPDLMGEEDWEKFKSENEIKSE